MIRRLGGFDAGFCVCYDLRFPELTRSLALAGAQMLIVAAAWPAARREHWKTLIRARAIENQCYVLAANRAGSDRGLRFCGASCVVGPRGEILAEASGSKEQVVLATLDPNSVQSARRQMPVLEHCRVSLRMRLS
jgi:predicted amidohydrolase